MEWLCKSENCKILLLIFVVFLAGYLIATNDESKKIRPRVEHFVDGDGEFLALDPTPTPVPATSEEAQRVLAKIDKVYRDVYNEPVPADKMSLYYKSLGATDFDEGAFRRRVSFERKAEFELLVKQVYEEVLKRPPTPSELTKYIDLYVRNDMRTAQDLQYRLRLDVEIAARSNAAKEAERVLTQNDTAEEANVVPGNDYATYKMIIATYQRVLDRHPNTDELQFYYNMVKRDGVSEKRISDILMSSREHEILTKNQKNEVYGELEQNITDKQLEIAITEIYRAIYQNYPEPDEYKFLRSKFVAFNLDEEKFARYIRHMKAAESGGDGGDVAIGAAGVSAKAQAQAQASTTPGIQGMDDIARAQVSTRTRENFADAVPDTTPMVMPDLARSATSTRSETLPPTMGTAAPQNTIGEELQRTAGTPAPVFAPPPAPPATSQTMLEETITKIKEECPFQRNRFENLKDMRKRGLNRDEPSACKFDAMRAIKYTNADDDMVLRPEFRWEVPQRRAPVCYATEKVEYSPLADQTALLGTLLEEADKTAVGSIMPKFKYTETL
jgi:hypothetical protein